MLPRFVIVLLVICLMLSGCSTAAWTGGSYVSVTPHLAQDRGQEPDVDWINNGEELYEALLSMVTFGRTNGVFLIQNYNTESLPEDIALAEERIKTTDPIGAYALESISYEQGVSGGQNTLAVTMEYTRSWMEILRIQKVQGTEGAKSAIEFVLNNTNADLVLYINDYKDVDFQQIVEDYARENPDKVLEVPQVNVDVYPEQGKDRVAEFRFTYQTNRENLRNMQGQVARVFESARLYVSSDESAYEKYAHLYVFLMERYKYKYGTSITPSYSLLRHGVGDSRAFAVVYAAMCRQSGLECMIVSGTRNGEPWTWNMISHEDGYYHLDLLRCVDDGGFYERADDEMEGYVWDYSAYPACERKTPPEETLDATLPETGTDTEPADTELTEPPTIGEDHTDPTQPEPA